MAVTLEADSIDDFGRSAPSEIAPGGRFVCRDPDNRGLCILVAAALTWAAHSSFATTCVAPDIFAIALKYASMSPNKDRDQPACFCIDRLWLRSVST